ncbi:MAG: glycosyltransferase family 39 protein [Proteobacteria bacterium]|nr:glycosyltransferase family 39 protein [Pseudomonadota bacterium]
MKLPTPSRPRIGWRALGATLPTALCWLGAGLAAAGGALHLVLLGAVIVRRVGYPLDLEWMEGGMLCHALRVLQGQPIYAPPSADFIPHLYTPLYPWIVASVARVTGLGYGVARGVSVLAFVVACALVARVVWRHAGGRLWGALWATAAVGLVASTFPHTGSWYDLARNDSLQLALITAALVLLAERASSWRAVLAAGALMGLAFLAKQTAAIFVLASGGLLLLRAPRRWPLYVVVVGLVAGGTTLWLQHSTRGWFWRYVFELHQGHDVYWTRIWPQTEVELAKRFPAVALVLGLWSVVALARLLRRGRLGSGREGRGWWWWAVALTGVAAAAIGFATQWAETNAYIPALFFASLLAGVAGSDLVRWAGGLGRGRRWRAAATALVVGGALAGQLVTQRYAVAAHVPSANDRAAAGALLRLLASVRGPLLVPYHPFYPYLVGQPTHFHQMGTNDVLRAGLPLPPEIADRVTRRRYRAIVLDRGLDDRYAFVLRDYEIARQLAPEESPEVVTGYRVRPTVLLRPRRERPAPR